MKEFSFLRTATLLVALGMCITALEIQAGTPVVLTDNNSTASIDPYSQAGMYQWALDGHNQLAQQWFWFRADGMTHDQSIETIAAPTLYQPDGRSLYASYNNGSYGVEIDYLLTGGTPGVSNQWSDIAESISITNDTASPLTFHFFQYSNFILDGTPGNQTIQLGKNLRGFYNEAVQQTASGNVALSETVVTPGANHGEAGLFNSTLANLNGNTAYNLNDNSGPLGPGNATWALQWDFVIPGYSSVGISKDKYLSIVIVPEPASVVLLAAGLLGGLVYRRRKS